MAGDAPIAARSNADHGMHCGAHTPLRPYIYETALQKLTSHPEAKEGMHMTHGDTGVTLAQLRAWVGEAIFKRGQDYELRGKVRELAATPAGELLAWVHGSERYATRVSLAADQLAADCTCPYGGICKHAVAVALAYLNRSEQAPPLPIAAASDVRLAMLERKAAAALVAVQAAGLPTIFDPNAGQDPELRAFLADRSQDELVALLIDLAQRYPDVREAIAVRQMLANGNADELEAEVRERIVTASAGSGWLDEWGDEGNGPDYGPVYQGLTLLWEQGHADAVVRLGEHLLESGIRQVEHSHDDGETGNDIAMCLAVVFQALPSSSLAPAAQLSWAINAMLGDPYDLCYGAHDVLEQPYPAEAWSIVADGLLAHINTLPTVGTDFLGAYRRNQATDFAILALEKAGRDAEIIQLCEREASTGNGYQRLIQRLLAAGRRSEAEQWARTGIAATARQYPGIASALRETLCKLRSEAGDWASVAALRAETFFEGPSLATLQVMTAAAEQAGVAPAVRAAALHYLESGQLPQRVVRNIGGTTIPPWPLPETGLAPSEPRYPLQFPQVGLLIELAISENQPAEVLRWYERRGTARYAVINDDSVADALVRAYPERSAAIWQKLAEAHIAQTNTAAYEEAALALRKLRRVRAEQGQIVEWRNYVDHLRTMNKRKRRLVETLDALLREKG
jgi:uncharacterized Zn finger protein